MEIIFENPKYLFYLLFVPVVIITHYLVLRISKKAAIPFANYAALSRVSKKYIFTQNNHQLFIRILAIISIVFALSGLTLIYSSEASTPNTVVIIDASDSMVESGAFGEAKAAAIRYVQELHSLSKIGIISYSTVAKVVRIPEAGKQQAIAAIREVQPHSVGGTDIGTAIANGVYLFAALRGEKRILLLSDGRASFGTALSDALEQAAAQGVVIDSVVLNPAEAEQELYATSALQLIANITDGRVYQGSIGEEVEVGHGAKTYLSLREYLLVAALVIITLEWALAKSIYKTVPHDQ